MRAALPMPGRANRIDMPIIVDTSALYALADADSPRHHDMRKHIEETRDVLVMPVTILPEVDYLVTTRLGVRVEIALMRDIAGGALRLENLTHADLDRCVEIITKYADSDIGFVDASIVAIAERLRITKVLTLDRRHFGLIAPRHCDSFDILPK